MKVEFEQAFEPGDLVEPDLKTCMKHNIVFRKRDWPWVVIKEQWDTVVVERRGRRERWWKGFLKKVVLE